MIRSSAEAFTLRGNDAQYSRAHWIDELRGIAILLVVFLHAVAIPADAGSYVPGFLTDVALFFAPVRLPVLVFLSGALAPRSLQKSSGVFVAGKLRYIGWPLLVWGVIRVVASRNDMPLSALEEWVNPGYLWYLSYLVVYYLVALLLARLGPVVFSGLFLLLAALLPSEGLRVGYYGVIFGLGWYMARNGIRCLGDVGPWIGGLGLGGAAGLGVVAVVGTSWIEELYWLPVVALGTIGIVWLASKTLVRRRSRVLDHLGRNSIVYYCAHLPIISVVLLISDRVGFEHSWLLALIAAFAGSAALAVLRGWGPIGFLFVFPFGRR